MELVCLLFCYLHPRPHLDKTSETKPWYGTHISVPD